MQNINRQKLVFVGKRCANKILVEQFSKNILTISEWYTNIV